jgi:hypothetical protein
MNEEDYAIVVGINRYHRNPPRPLSGAVSDATKFAEWLLLPEEGGVPSKNLRLITSQDDLKPEDYFNAKPIKHDIDVALNEFQVGQKRRVGRRLYFYFAGHGLGGAIDDVALLMANTARHLLNSNLGLRKYREYLINAAAFDNLIFFLDCCWDFENRIEGQGPQLTYTLNENNASKVKDFVVFATSYGKQSYEPIDPDTGEHRGLLTKALLEGLKEKNVNAADPRGHFTAASLGRYIEDRVPELAKEAGVIQKPEIPKTPDGLEFGQPIDIPRVSVKVTADPGISGELLLYSGGNVKEVLDRRRAAQTPWELSLPAQSLFLVEHMASNKKLYIDTRETRESDVYHFKA